MMARRLRGWSSGCLLVLFACGDAGQGATDGASTSTSGASATSGEVVTGGTGGEAFAFTHLGVGDDLACAAYTHPDGLVCWSVVSSPSPKPLAGVGRVTSLAMSLFHRCFVVDGAVSCWGKDDAGQLGPGGATDTPRLVAGLPPDVTAVSTGSVHTVALVDGELWWWGGVGQEANGFPEPPGETPQRYMGLPAGTVEHVAAGGYHTCAVIADTVYCWGANHLGQLGQGHADPVMGAVAVPGLPAPVTALAANVGHTCAVAGGNVYCWGRNIISEIGTGMAGGQFPSPQLVAGVSEPTGLALGTAVSCVLLGDQVEYWGRFGYFEPALTPTLLPDAQGVTLVAHGDDIGCAVVAGVVHCWGLGTEADPLADIDLDTGGPDTGGPTTDDPYGQCVAASNCPVAGSNCPGSSKACQPPCATPTDCPGPQGGGFAAACVNERCVFECSVQAPACPGAMVCLGGLACGYP